MLTLRLPAPLEEQLSLQALKLGVSKNQIVQQALSDHLSFSALSDVPLDRPVMEAKAQLFAKYQDDRKAMYQKAHEVADWIKSRAIWTKKFDPMDDGSPTPGAYGRNVVIGFSDTLDELHVISRNMATETSWGTDHHHLYITTFDDWVKYMEVRELRAG